MIKFEKLNPDAIIFNEIKTTPNWWKLFSSDKELYIDIRKDNYINVYYYGGSLAKIQYRKEFVATINVKYSIDKRDKLNLNTLTEEEIAELKNNITKEYLDKGKNQEKPAEKKIQGKIILKNPIYIDSEFAYNKDKEIPNLRIDLVELQNNVLSFVELKGITDNRLLNDEKRNIKVPKIIEQMDNYQKFINKYEKEIIYYYHKLIQLKIDLGLLKHIKHSELRLNKSPKLLIVDTYKKLYSGREERIGAIKELLSVHKIDFSITKYEM